MDNQRPSQLCLLFALVSLQIFSVHGQCAGTESSLDVKFNTFQAFFTPNYPSSYANNQICQWKLDSGAAERRVVISYIAFNLETNYDFLYVYDGDSTVSTQLSRDTGSITDKFYISSGQYLYVKFTSDYSVTWSGFHIQYISILGTIELPACNSIVTLNTSSVGKEEQFALNTFPDPLDSRFLSLCEWTVTTPITNNHYELKIVFTDIDFNDVYSCNAYTQYGLSIYRGSNLTYQTCSHLPDNGITIYGSGSQNTAVRFRIPHINGIDRGFIITLKYTGDIAPVSTTPIPTTIRVSSACGSESNPTSLHASNITQYVTSPNYPSQYSNHLNCWWKISASSTDNGVWLSIQQVDTDLSDTITIYDGPSSSYTVLATYTGIISSHSLPLKSSGNSLTIHLSTDGSSTGTGFSFGYFENMTVIPSCVPISYEIVYVTNVTTTIISHPGYGTTYYSNNMDQYWLIDKGSETSSLFAKLVNFNIESSTNCVYDYLSVYNGACVDENNRLYFLCGEITSTDYEHHNGRYLLLHFHTDGSVTYGGWQITVRASLDANTDSSTDDDGMDIGRIIGFIILGLIALTVFVYGCVMTYRKHKRRTVPIQPQNITEFQNKPPVRKKLLPHAIVIRATLPKPKPEHHKYKRETDKTCLIDPPRPPATLNPSRILSNRQLPPVEGHGSHQSTNIQLQFPKTPPPNYETISDPSNKRNHNLYNPTHSNLKMNPQDIPPPFNYIMPPQLQ